MSEAVELRSEDVATKRLRLLREIAQVSDTYYQEAQEIAERMHREDLETAQVRNLENIAYTTDKVSDITDFVKRQVGRRKWEAELGRRLLDALNARQAEARRIAGKVDARDQDLPRRTHLLLCREYVRHLAAHFVYVSGGR